MSISKKKLKAIDSSTVMGEVLLQMVDPYYKSGMGLQGRHFLDDRPEEWTNTDRQLFDVATEIETRLKRKIIAILDPSTIEVEEPDEDE